MSKLVEELGKRLSHFMLERDLNDYSLAKVAKIARPRITKLRNGSGNPTMKTIEALAKALSHPIVDFFKDEITLSVKTESELQKENKQLREILGKIPDEWVARLAVKSRDDLHAIAARAFLTKDVSELIALRLPESSMDLLKKLIEKNGLQRQP